MSDPLLQSLLAMRKACVQLKTELAPAHKARLDLVTTLLSKLLFDEQQLPALQRQLAADRAALGDDPQQRRARARVETEFARACETAIGAEIRAGEALAQADDPQNEVFDKSAFREYLIRTLGESPSLEIADVRLASRGFSKKTILVELRNNRVLPAELALRVDRAFNFLGTTVMDEYAPLVALHRAGVRLPQPFALEPTGKVLDGPFIVFEKKSGGLIGNNFQAPAPNERIAADVAAALAQVHRTPREVLPGLRGSDMDCVAQARSEIDKSRADWVALKRSLPLMDAAFDWLYAHVDWAAGEQAVVHGDYNFNNILIDGERVSAIVDWEFLHLGNPAADLGWFHYGATGICGWEKFLQLYRDAGGYTFSRQQLDFHILLGQTRLAVMTLQTESGFNDGEFDDVKFGLSGALYTNKSLIRIGEKLQTLI